MNLLRCFILYDHFAYTGCLCVAYGRWKSWKSYYSEGHSCRNGDIFSSTGNCLLHMKILNIIWLLKNSINIIVFVRSITEMLFQTLNCYSQWFLSFHILSVIWHLMYFCDNLLEVLWQCWWYLNLLCRTIIWIVLVTLKWLERYVIVYSCMTPGNAFFLNIHISI